MGFSDEMVGQLADRLAEHVRELRQQLGMRPVYKMVDTCAAEFDAATPYFYSTYEEENEAHARAGRLDGSAGERADPDRTGDRVRLRQCARRLGAPGPRPPRDPRELEPGDGLHGLRHKRPALLRAAGRGSGAQHPRERGGGDGRDAHEHRAVRGADRGEPGGAAVAGGAADHRVERGDDRHGRGPRTVRALPAEPRHPPAPGGGRAHARGGAENGANDRLPGARASLLCAGRQGDGDRAEPARDGCLPGAGGGGGGGPRHPHRQVPRRARGGGGRHLRRRERPHPRHHGAHRARGRALGRLDGGLPAGCTSTRRSGSSSAVIPSRSCSRWARSGSRTSSTSCFHTTPPERRRCTCWK